MAKPLAAIFNRQARGASDNLTDVLSRHPDVIRPAAERINKLGGTLVDGKVTAEFTASVQRIKLLTLFELAGFLTLFTCMILMRFGY